MSELVIVSRFLSPRADAYLLNAVGGTVARSGQSLSRPAWKKSVPTISAPEVLDLAIPTVIPISSCKQKLPDVAGLASDRPSTYPRHDSLGAVNRRRYFHFVSAVRGQRRGVMGPAGMGKRWLLITRELPPRWRSSAAERHHQDDNHAGNDGKEAFAHSVESNSQGEREG